MTREEIIHIFENSRLVSEHFDSEAVTAAYIEGLAALREQEERRWIPVEERLPEKTGTYFVVTKTGAVTFARFYPEHDFIDCTGKFIRHEKGNFQTNRNVIYWMPLPEPPKGE